MKDTALAPWTGLICVGMERAMSGLSKMIEREITVDSFAIRRVPVSEIADLVGGPEIISVGVYLTVSGAADGHLMLLYEPKTARAFVDLLMMQPPDTTGELGEMERSALSEMGNVMGSAFLSALADATDLDLRPSPPALMVDMAGALLDVVTSSIMLTQDETYLVENAFVTDDRSISGTFFVMPSEELQDALVAAKRAA